MTKKSAKMESLPPDNKPSEEPRQYSSVSEMVRDLSVDKALGEKMARDIESRNIINLLMALRTAQDMSQADIAKKMGCSQSRVSKLENGVDDDLRLGDFHAYADALGLEMSMFLAKKQRTMADALRYHTTEVCRIVNRFTQLVADSSDASITKGVHGCLHPILASYCQSFTALSKAMKEVSKQLEMPQQEKLPVIQMDENTDEENEVETFSAANEKQNHPAPACA